MGKMLKRRGRSLGQLSLVALLLGVVIIGILFAKLYFRGSPVVDKEAQKVMSEQGLNTSTAESTLDSAEKRIGEIQPIQAEQAQKMMDYQ